VSIFREQYHCSGNSPTSDLTQSQETERKKKMKELIEFAEVCK